MDEGRIVLVGNETDLLHCGYNFPLSQGGIRYPSADHFAHAMILNQLGLDEVHILELLSSTSAEVPMKCRELLRENMPAGHDMNTLASFLVSARHAHTMNGLKLRAEQDSKFRDALMETGNALLVVCDRNDSELAVGMDEVAFLEFMKKHSANFEVVSRWTSDATRRPPELGQNQLGFILMWLRYEIKVKQTEKWTTNQEILLDGLNLDSETEELLKISASNLVITLEGIFKPLSNYYAMPLELKGETYRSVEHYAYQRLFEALKLDEYEVQKLRSTVKPADLAVVANRVAKRLKIDPSDFTHKKLKMDRWRQSAMKHKITKNDYLQQLLLSTGFAVLIDCSEAIENRWTSGVDEFELQELLTKPYITPTAVIDYMCERTEPPKNLSHLIGNRGGIFLMELRQRFAQQTAERIPLVAPLTSNSIRTTVSSHMICFTPESILHPYYPAEIRPEDQLYLSPIHFVAQKACKFFDLDSQTEEYLLKITDTLECWSQLHHIIEDTNLPQEKLQKWFYEERQSALKEAMRWQFDQHPPLMRALLETEDALMVCCSRFSSSEAELSVGMRERDMRLWCAQIRYNTKELMDLFLRPMAFRPAFVGGNRIGLILMELRREFILKGTIPHLLPDLGMAPDVILGSESPLENYVPHIAYNIIDDDNFSAIWANPLILTTKASPDTELHRQACSIKAKPPLIALMDEHIDEILVSQQELSKQDFRRKIVEEKNVELCRGAFTKQILMLRAGIMRDFRSQRILNFWSRHTGNVQSHRRLIENRTEALIPPPIAHPPPPSRPLDMNPWGPSQGPRDSPLHNPPPKIPSLLNDMNRNKHASRSPPPQHRRYDQRRNDRDWNDRRNAPPPRPPMNRRDISPDRSRFHRNGGQQRFGPPTGRGGQPIRPSGNGTVHTPQAPPPKEEPKPKKPKKIVNEEDLSEGEILSSDED